MTIKNIFASLILALFFFFVVEILEALLGDGVMQTVVTLGVIFLLGLAFSKSKRYQRLITRYFEWGFARRGKTGEISLPRAGATLSLPPGFLFFDVDSHPDVFDTYCSSGSREDVYGLIVAHTDMPLAMSWLAFLFYEDIGYVPLSFDPSSAQKPVPGVPSPLSGRLAPGLWCDQQRDTIYLISEYVEGSKGTRTPVLQSWILGRRGILRIVSWAGSAEEVESLDTVVSLTQRTKFSEGSRHSDFDSTGDVKASYNLEELLRDAEFEDYTAKRGMESA